MPCRQDPVDKTTSAYNLLVELGFLTNDQTHLAVLPIFWIPPSLLPVYNTRHRPRLRRIVRYHNIAEVQVAVAKPNRAVAIQQMPAGVLELPFSYRNVGKHGELEIVVEGLDAVEWTRFPTQEWMVSEEAVTEWPSGDGSCSIEMVNN